MGRTTRRPEPNWEWHQHVLWSAYWVWGVWRCDARSPSDLSGSGIFGRWSPYLGSFGGWHDLGACCVERDVWTGSVWGGVQSKGAGFGSIADIWPVCLASYGLSVDSGTRILVSEIFLRCQCRSVLPEAAGLIVWSIGPESKIAEYAVYHSQAKKMEGEFPRPHRTLVMSRHALRVPK